MLDNNQNKTNELVNPVQDRINYYFAFFLVYVTPLSVPLACYSLYTGQVSASALWVALGLFILSGLGISVGYHRLLTHNSFSTQPWVKYLLLVFGAMAMQGTPASWAAIHMQHHVYADKDGDPHSPKVSGFWHAHCGWLFADYQPDMQRYGKRFVKDPIVRHISKYFLVYCGIGVLIPVVLFGWVGLVWGVLLRLFLSCNLTWLVNSWGHMAPKANLKTKDCSENHFLLALFTFGEGWHRNHHSCMQSPYFGQKWYEIDMGKWLIKLIEHTGLGKTRKILNPIKH